MRQRTSYTGPEHSGYFPKTHGMPRLPPGTSAAEGVHCKLLARVSEARLLFQEDGPPAVDGQEFVCSGCAAGSRVAVEHFCPLPQGTAGYALFPLAVTFESFWSILWLASARHMRKNSPSL